MYHCTSENLEIPGSMLTHRPGMTTRQSPFLAKPLPSRPKFQTLQTRGDVDADLALHAQGLQRDGIVGTANQHIAADADADRGASLRARVVAGEIAWPEAGDRRIDRPAERGLLGDTEIDANFADGGDIAVLRHALDTEHAAEIGHRAHDEADAGTAAAFEHADPHTRRLLRIGDACGSGEQCR